MIQPILDVALLDQTHPEYQERTWSDIDLLARGGDDLRDRAASFLWPREREPEDVYQSRLKRFSYQNLLGTVLAWYGAAIFEEDPSIIPTLADGSEAGEDIRAFYSAWMSNANGGGMTFSDLFRNVFHGMMISRSAYVLTDLPATDPAAFATRREQQASGALDPFLVVYGADSVLNWDTDSKGNLLWAVIRATTEDRSFATTPGLTDRWYYFDREDFAVYGAKRQRGHDGQLKKAKQAELLRSGRHALADKMRCPVRRICVPDLLWLGSRALLAARAHLNLQNSFYWGLHHACLPVPYIKGEVEGPTARSEVAYIQLPIDGDIGYLEPSGTSFELASREIEKLREEIYRQMYLQAQGRSSTASASAASGYSKELDMAPARPVLAALGDVLRKAMTEVLSDVADARGDDVRWDVRGYDFPEEDDERDIAETQAALDIDLGSETFERELKRKLARKLLRDARPETIKSIDDEIAAAPTRDQRAEQERANQRDRLKALLPATQAN